MQANEGWNADPGLTTVPWNRNLRHVPHPISTDPRFNPIHEQEHEQNEGRANSTFGARIPGLYLGMLPSNGEEGYHDLRMKCCCGQPDCAYLEHNNAALGGLERDLETAARLGQVCEVQYCHVNSRWHCHEVTSV